MTLARLPATHLNQAIQNNQGKHDTRLCPQEVIADLPSKVLLNTRVGITRSRRRWQSTKVGDASGLSITVAYRSDDGKGDGDGQGGESEEGGDPNIGVVEFGRLPANGDDADKLPEEAEEAEYGDDDLPKGRDDALTSGDGVRCEC